MKNKLIKNTLVSLHRTRGRFISIMTIIAIGCAFFSGLKASAPYMKASAWDYFNAEKLADIHLNSTLGFNDDDLAAVASADNVETAEKGCSADLLISRPDENIIVKAYSYNENDTLDKFILEEGRLPENDNECLADFKPYKCGSFSVGEKITLSSPDSDTDISDVLSNTEYTVVGLIRSPVYVGLERGSTTVGDGVLNSYIYIPENNFSYDVYTDIYVTGAGFSDIDPYTDEYEERTAELKDTLEKLGEERIDIRTEELRSELMEDVDKERQKLADAEKEYSDGLSAYNDGVQKVKDGRAELDAQLAAVDPLYLDAVKGQFDEMYAELDESEKQLAESKAQLDDAKEQIDDGYAQIADAEKEIDENLSDNEWYVFDRDDLNPGYTDYGSDTERVDAVAKVFPVFFILVAALVCVCTMTRMVEEQRTETGTLKALGFGNAAIASQYILYAAAASLIGSTIGVCIGLPLIPRIIFMAYQTMYAMPYISTPFLWGYFAGCLIVSLVCTGFSAGIAARTELISTPAQLMRPKPPKNGKRVLLERIPFIWKHLSFTYKVTFRNLFRYKSRFFMTVIGIAGCTALLLTGFGLQYAISSIVDLQFGGIYKYDVIAVIDEKANDSDLSDLDTLLSDENVMGMGAYQKTKTASNGEKNADDCYVFAPEDTEKMNDYIVIQNRKTKEPLHITADGAIITEKLSRLLDVKVGDSIDIDGGTRAVKITGIAENYTGHYIFMTKETCLDVFGENGSNVMLVNMNGISDTEFSSKLLKNPAVQAVSYARDGSQKFNDLIGSMNLVVVLIIVFAGALAFVILFNLVSISINERMRELATIKVLGFFDKEVSAYVYRENLISTLIGIACGLVLGIAFEKYVLMECEVDAVMFNPDITAHCFVYSALITAFFAFTVNLFMHFRLTKIDMAASMKAVE